MLYHANLVARYQSWEKKTILYAEIIVKSRAGSKLFLRQRAIAVPYCPKSGTGSCGTMTRWRKRCDATLGGKGRGKCGGTWRGGAMPRMCSMPSSELYIIFCWQTMYLLSSDTQLQTCSGTALKLLKLIYGIITCTK